MWQILLGLFSQRAILLLVALATLNVSKPQTTTEKRPRIYPVKVLMSDFLQRISDADEVRELKELAKYPAGHVLGASRHPFLWLSRWLMGLTNWSEPVVLLVLSNLFLILFLGELHGLINRFTTSDVALSACLLAIFWPTSYEWSLGSSDSFTGYLILFVLKNAIDNRWIIAGCGEALLWVLDPIALGLIPCLLFSFWYFERHYYYPQILKRLLFIVVPFALILFYRPPHFAEISQMISHSTLLNLFNPPPGTSGKLWTFSNAPNPYVGQTLSLLFFFAGAVLSLVSSIGIVGRLIPINQLFVVALFTPYSQLASKLLFAGPCLQGIASASTGFTMRLVRWTLFLLGMYEVYMVFSV